jgi:murein DD-endopeptidase MepM/ murein hydrolase activator NlpD
MIEMGNTMTFFKGANKLRTKLQLWSTQLSAKISRINLKQNIVNKQKWIMDQNWQASLKKYRMFMLKSMGSLGLIAVITVGGNQYVNANMVEVYHVYVNGEEAGVVSSPQVVDDYKINKIKELEAKNSKVHMVVNTDAVTLKGERAFKIHSEDKAALSNLDRMLSVHAVGVELVVDGKLIGTVKDKDEAEAILAKIKSKYLPTKLKTTGKVNVLSATDKTPGVGESVIDKAEFVQQVAMNQVNIEPNALMNPDDIVKKLETGDVQPKKYKVVEGDCVSCIAKKFNISPQLIYNNNPALVETDRLQVGQVLDLTLLEPTLSVRTVEKVVEQQEVQYETKYKLDDSLRAGVIKETKPGVNGMKKVTIQLTKLNGLMEAEEMISEEIMVQPQSAEAIRGTKVIQGEGTGKFAWPVIGSSLSSGFGNRWGKFHKGVDLTSGNRSILASDNGRVIYAGYKSDYGNHIIIDHLNGYTTVYGHLSKMNVVVGKIVEKGEKIGIMGSTGDSTGTHLHFEVRLSDNPQNPLKYLNR